MSAPAYGVCVALAALAAQVAAAPGLRAQEGTVLRGEVLTRDGRPAEGVRLFLIGHPPEVVIRDGGFFTHPLDGAPREVTARVARSGPADAPGGGASTLEVVYPPGGRITVPADPTATVTLVVGDAVGSEVQEALQAQEALLRQTLESRGVDRQAIEAALDADVRGLLEELARRDSALVATTRNQAEQAEVRREIGSVLSDYRRRLWDLLEVFRLMGPQRDIGTSEFLGLRDAMTAYNQGFEALTTRRAGMLDGVRTYWPANESASLEPLLQSALTIIDRSLHDRVLQLNDALVVVQRKFLDRPPSDSELRAARETIAETTGELNRHFPALDEVLDALYGELGIASGGRP